MTRKILGKLLEEATEVRKKKKKIRGPFWKKILGCVEDRREIARTSIRQFWGGYREETILRRGDRRIDRRKIFCSQELGFVLFSVAFGKSSQASATDELQEREVMRGLSETVEVL